MNEVSALRKENPQSSPAPSTHVRTQEEVDSLQYRRELSLEPDHPGTLISEFQTPEP